MGLMNKRASTGMSEMICPSCGKLMNETRIPDKWKCSHCKTTVDQLNLFSILEFASNEPIKKGSNEDEKIKTLHGV